MTTPNDGGPAFPHVESYWDKDADQYLMRPSGGMTLRDWFAGQALANCKICDEGTAISKNALWAYDVADAMLRARGQSCSA